MTLGSSNIRDRTGTEKRVLVAKLAHKTNTFVGGRTGLEDFEIRRGEETMRAGGEDDLISGVLEVALENGWEVLSTLDVSAAPGATVADPVVELFWAEFCAVADREQQRGVDGVFLVLHGAMVSESHNDVEGEVLRRIRSVGHLSDVPICGVMSPRTNFTESMRRQSDGLIAYRDDPTDTRDVATLAATILDGLMQTENRPATVWDHPPIMWPLSGTVTDEGSMHVLEERAREIEAELPDILAVNVLSGFPFADVPEAGLSFSAVTTGDLELSRGALRELRELNVIASSLRDAGTSSLTTLEEAMARLEYHNEGPVLLIEPSDNVEAGAAGDATHVLSPARPSREEVRMGPCTVVRHGDVAVLLTSRRTPPLDLGQWRSQGIDPEDLFAIGVKASTEHRPAYDPIARASYTLDLPGPCAENLGRLPFENVTRPVYPLDEL